MAMDFNKLMKQAQQMQEQLAQAQEEAATQVVEASAGGGMETVKATGAGEITEIKIKREAVDPDDVEVLEDMVLAAVNEAMRSAESLMQSKLGGVAGGARGGGGPRGLRAPAGSAGLGSQGSSVLAAALAALALSGGCTADATKRVVASFVADYNAGRV